MAKKFAFRLERLLSLRSHRVEQEKNALLEIQGKRIAKENEIAENYTMLANAYANKVGTTTIEMLQINYHRQIFIKERIAKLEKERLNLLEIEEQRRKILSEALRDEKVLEKLKERQLENYKHEMNCAENAFMDEIVNNKAARQNMEASR